MISEAAIARTGRLLDRARTDDATSIVDLLRYDDAACVVTGGAKGIGFAIADRFAELGAAITLFDLHDDVQASAVRLRERHGARVTVIEGDVRDSAAVERTAREAMAGVAGNGIGRLVWVNSAGVYPTDPISEMTDEAWQRVIDIDLTGTFHGCRAAARAIREAGLTGVIVNIGSVAGFRTGAPPGIAHYAAAKHGINGLTAALAVELGRDGIRVVGIAPATIVSEGLIEQFGDDPALMTRMSAHLPLRRPGLPDDVARAAVFLASPMASMVTGSTLAVDGGHLAL